MHVLALDRHRAALQKQYKAEIAHLKHHAGAPGFDAQQLARLRSVVLAPPVLLRKVTTGLEM